MSIGKVIPNHLTEQLIGLELIKATDGNAFILDYPRTIQQFESMERYLSKYMITTTRIWHFKHADFNRFILQYYKEKQKWIDKYGDEIKDNWIERHCKKTTEIESLKKVTDKYQWIDIELTCENFRDSAEIENKILKTTNDKMLLQ